MESHNHHYYKLKRNKQKTHIDLNDHHHQSQLSSRFIMLLIGLFIGPDPFVNIQTFDFVNPFNIRPYYFIIFAYFDLTYCFIVFAYFNLTYCFIVFHILSFIKITNSIIGILIIITFRFTISSLLIIGNS